VYMAERPATLSAAPASPGAPPSRRLEYAVPNDLRPLARLW
jgi:hypothetical protein